MKSSTKNTLIKWVGSILAGVIVSLIIWFLTNEGGPLNPAPEPDLKFLELNQVAAVAPGQSFELEIMLFNEGAATAENCTVNLYSGRHTFRVNMGVPDTPIRQDIRGIGGITPSERKSITVMGIDPPFISAGSHWITVMVKCDRSDYFWEYESIRVVNE